VKISKFQVDTITRCPVTEFLLLIRNVTL